MFVYYVYLFSFFVNTLYCFRKDCIINPDKELKMVLYKKYRQSFLLAVFNIVVIGYFGFLFVYRFYKPKPFNIYISTTDFIISFNVANISFYFIHRLFHSVKFLSKYHRVHHEFKDPIGLRAAYTHPIDYFFGNLIPLGLTPFLLNMDLITISFVIYLSIYSTVIREHSDYSDNRHHLDHHKFFNCNYGAKWLDKFFCTIKK
jgi:sterol desaturase/sphingolipid hydroxylase (fatty acid hydroxylase superfamily)